MGSAATAPLLTRVYRRLRDDLATADPRSLAAYRIVTGVLLIISVLLRWKNIDLFYTNAGIHTNIHIAFLPAPIARPSLLLGLGTGDEVRAFFVVAMLIYACLLVGYRTRMMQVLSFLCALSIHARSPFMSYGGDDVMRSFLLWTIFLPLGQRWSVDAWLARERGEPFPRPPVVSLAVFGIALQLAVIYGFTFYDKLTPVWHEGHAIHYTLWMDELVTPLTAWIRGWIPVWALIFLNWWTLFIEALAPILLLSPWKTGWCRLVGLLPLALLHLGIFFMIDVDLFSPTIVSSYLLFLTPGAWERIRRWVEPTLPALSRHLGPLPATPPRTGPLWTAGRFVREALAASLLISVPTNALYSSLLLPKRFKPSDGSPTLIWAYATNIWQRWGMFSDPPKVVGWFVISGRTRDGREIDPITGGPVIHELRTGYAPSLGIFLYYFSQTMRTQSKAAYATELANFVWRSHLLPGRDPKDEIIAFTAYSLERPSPPFGERTPGPSRAIELLNATRPGVSHEELTRAERLYRARLRPAALPPTAAPEGGPEDPADTSPPAEALANPHPIEDATAGGSEGGSGTLPSKTADAVAAESSSSDAGTGGMAAGSSGGDAPQAADTAVAPASEALPRPAQPPDPGRMPRADIAPPAGEGGAP